MSELKTRLEIELSLIAETLNTLPASRSCADLSTIELAGVAALIHSFYNGVEKIVKEILKSPGLPLPEGANWHRDLLQLAIQTHIMSEATAQALMTYTAFRHFFVHAYVLDLDAERLGVLLEQIDDVFAQFKHDLAKFL